MNEQVIFDTHFQLIIAKIFDMCIQLLIGVRIYCTNNPLNGCAKQPRIAHFYEALCI